jgi:pimeloyl-ACP methyl ester carboxylesterase
MRVNKQKAVKWLFVPIAIFALLLLMDSCLQFRMSKSDIDDHFKDSKNKGVLKQYTLDNRTINYLVAGDPDKPLVVFVHGSPGSLSAFIDFMSDSLLLQKAMLISVDRPGFGSSNFGHAEPSLQKQAAMLKPMLQEYKENRPIILVGHSLGGPLIARMAMDYPELIDGLVFVAASIDPELEPNETWFRAPLATPFLKWILPRSFRASNDEIYKLKPELEDMLPAWKNITVPSTFVQGKEDSFVPYQNVDFAKRKLVNAPLKIQLLEGVDHFIPWSHPQLIRQATLEMLENETLVSNK